MPAAVDQTRDIEVIDADLHSDSNSFNGGRNEGSRGVADEGKTID